MESASVAATSHFLVREYLARRGLKEALALLESAGREPKRLTIRNRENSFLTIFRLEVCRSISLRLDTPAPDLLLNSIGKLVLHVI